MITKETIDEIFATARVEEVIGDFISLKKSGSNFKGFSPFSTEKTPSFMVSPAKQIWKDFSSGKGGTVVSFLMEHEQYTYPEALRWLAKRYNIEIQEDREQTAEDIAQNKEKETLYVIMQKAQDFFREQLLNTEEGQAIGLSYFKERQIHKDLIDEFSLGYSPESWDACVQYLMNQGYTFKQLQDAGLAVGSENRPVDRFRDRVIFPIHSFSGRVLGFAGRILKSNVKAAKYLNSPETLIYHKSDILYGIFQAKQEIIKKDLCILVEGYTDVISLHQKGIKNVIASSGTALTPEQIRLIKRLTHQVILMYDGDAAGVKATQRSIDLILEQDLDVSIAKLPPEHDPDSFAKAHEKEYIESYLKNNSESFLTYKLHFYKDKNLTTTQQSEMIEEAVKSIGLINSELKQELLIREMAQLTTLSEDVLFRALGKTKKDLNKKEYKSATKRVQENELKLKQEVVNPFFIIEEEIIRTLLSYGNEKIEFEIDEKGQKEIFETKVIDEIIQQLEEDQIDFVHQYYAQMLHEIKKAKDNDGDLLQKIMMSGDQELNALVSKVAFEPYKLSDWTKKGMVIPEKEDNLKDHVENLILNYKRLVLKERITETLSQLEQDNTPFEQQKILEKVMFYSSILRKINQRLGRVI